MIRIPSLLLASFLFLFLAVTVSATSKVAFFTVKIPPNKFKALRVQNLPKDAHVAVDLESSRAVTVTFVDRTGYQELPRPQKPLMAGKVDQRLKFSVTIPETGDYFIVLVNPNDRWFADVKLKVSAARSAPDQIDTADGILQEFEQKMHNLFVFESFPIGVDRCGRKLAFYGTDGFYLCGEYVKMIYAKVQERSMAVKVLSFSIFHELALELMEQWEIDNHRSLRHSADELAVVIMIMLKQEANLQELCRYFVAHPNMAASFRTELIDIWHPLSVERARKILVWLDNLDMVRSWQEVLVPHMQTELLKWLQKNPTDWLDPTLVEKELAKRYKNSPPPAETKKRNAGELISQSASFRFRAPNCINL